MSRTYDNPKLNKAMSFLSAAFSIGLILILGSCVLQMNDVGGGHRANQKAVEIFFVHLLVWLPCLCIIFGYFHIKLEKKYMSKAELDSLNAASKAAARKSLRNDFGLLSQFLSLFIKTKDKNKD